jgi:hypothetical protein
MSLGQDSMIVMTAKFKNQSLNLPFPLIFLKETSNQISFQLLLQRLNPNLNLNQIRSRLGEEKMMISFIKLMMNLRETGERFLIL